MIERIIATALDKYFDENIFKPIGFE